MNIKAILITLVFILLCSYLYIVLIGINFTGNNNEDNGLRIDNENGKGHDISKDNLAMLWDHENQIYESGFHDEANEEIAMEAIFLSLENYASQYDPAFIPKIAAFLQHNNPEVREAAVEAIVQLGERDAIPILRRLARVTKDQNEAQMFLDAAEYLELPSIHELRNRRSNNFKDSNKFLRKNQKIYID